MLQSKVDQAERVLRHERAVIFVPRPDSRLDQEIAPGSGIVGVMSGERMVLYFEGNLFGAENLTNPEERLVCAFGRAATGYPTAAIRGVMPNEYFDLIRVGEMTWPNSIQWDSPASAQVFLNYVGRPQGSSKKVCGGVSRLNVLEMDMTSLLGLYENPRTLEEWRWIEGHASFEHTQNDVGTGVFEFMVHVRDPQSDEDPYESPPPQMVAAILDLAHKMGSVWVLFHQG